MKVIAIAGSDRSGEILANSISTLMRQKFKTFFQNVAYTVACHDIADDDAMNVEINMHDNDGKELKIWCYLPRNLATIGDMEAPAKVTFLQNGKEHNEILQPRVIKMRGIEWAIVTTITRKATQYLNFDVS